MLKRILLGVLFCMGLFLQQSQAQPSVMDGIHKQLLDTLIAHARQNYPKVKFMQARINASTANLSRQKAGWFESLTFSYVMQPPNNVAVNATKPVFLTGYQLGLFVNVGSLIQRPAIIKQAKEELIGFQQEANEYEIMLATEVKKRYYVYVQQEVSLRLISKTIIDGQAMLQDARVRYEKSELSFEEYSKVLISTNATIQTKLDMETNMLVAIASIEELCGQGFMELKKQYGTK
ncbi:MAG: hypothetical protein EOO61_14160 [Hymenobacter sp.]|nr:MAG: hypothetical protein EOO61_14160 [Hymenobacter sp.]